MQMWGGETNWRTFHAAGVRGLRQVVIKFFTPTGLFGAESTERDTETRALTFNFHLIVERARARITLGSDARRTFWRCFSLPAFTRGVNALSSANARVALKEGSNG
jgi:hypothetical protein